MGMKKVLTLVAAASLIAAASTAFAAKSIIGSKHDLSPGGTATLSGNVAASGNAQLCVYCHTPHNATQANVLWNRNAGVTAAADFKLYSGVGMANTSFGSGFTADSTSLFCMSCHDGVTNVNNVAHNMAGGTLRAGLVGGTADLTGGDGVNLTRTHPVNFPVTTNSQADLWIGTVTTGPAMGTDATGAYLTQGGISTFTKGFPLFKSARDAAGQTRSLECGSCHSVHDAENQPFLRYTMNQSALCLGCHNK